LIKSSLTSQANLFQLFHPIGGINATPFSHARASHAPVSKIVKATAKNTSLQTANDFIAFLRFARTTSRY
jgi:hypothetical protein